MKWLLLILSFISAFFGVVVFANSSSSIHEIIGLAFFIIASVLFAGYGVMTGIEDLKNSLQEQKEK